MSDDDVIEFQIIEGRKYFKTHLWFHHLESDEETGDLYKVGITDFLQADLGDLIRVILPQPTAIDDFNFQPEEGKEQLGTGAKEAGVTGHELHIGDALVTLRTTEERWVIETPFACNVVELNGEVEDCPELVNEDPYSDGWLLNLRPHDLDPEDLLEPDEYLELLSEFSD